MQVVESKHKEIEFSSFSLAKGKELIGDDYLDVKKLDEVVVAVLCDGVGSADEGREAAKRVVTYLINNFKNRIKSWPIEKTLKTFITSINKILYNESIELYEREEFLTTLTIVVIDNDTLYGANVGDSRIYLKRDDKLSILSIDHSEENMLLEAIGMREDVNIYYFENKLQKNDEILLCSDGLYNVLDEEEIKKYISLGAYSLVKTASSKCDDNLPDDTSAIVIKINDISPINKLKNLNLEIPQNLKPNQIIDGYKLIKPLIQNERTWLVENKTKKYIMKFPLIEAKENKELLDQFIKEAWNAVRLKAGFFPKAVIPKKRSYRYYIQEYIDRVNLKEYIKKHPLFIDDAINLAKTLLNASQYLLKYNLVHADIKPENIIVTKRGDKLVFKIIDFGNITEIYSINSTAGTPSYLAPERFQKELINESTEIFAIGVVLYEALTKKLPYGEIEPFQTPTFKPATPPKKLNPKIPDWLNSVILRAIDINNRYTHYSEMAFEISTPDKVKPYFDESKPLIERDPAKAYKIMFIISLVMNFVFLYFILK